MPASFPTTRWTLVARAGDDAGGDAAARLALDELVRAYAPALRARLRFDWRLSDAEADDLLQAFLTEKVVERALVASADPARGRFRTFLLTALDRFAVDQARRRAALKRSPDRAARDVDNLADARPAGADPANAFDRAWAQQAVGEALGRLRAECAADPARGAWWVAFELRVLRPATDGAAPVPHELIAQQLGLPSAAHASNALGSAKRAFTRIFRGVVAAYAADDAEADDELRALWAIFARPKR